MSSYTVTLPKPLKITVTAPIIQSSESLPDAYDYPILSQTTSYRTRDEGDQITAVWDSVYNDGATTRKGVIELSDFYTLKVNNPFGNTFRFTTPAGAEPATDGSDINTIGEIIEDHYLGIRLINIGSANGSWESYIDATGTYSGGTYYPLPQIIANEIHEKEGNFNRFNKYFPTTLGAVHWTATTSRHNTAVAPFLFYPRSFDYTTKSTNRNYYLAYNLL